MVLIKSFFLNLKLLKESAIIRRANEAVLNDGAQVFYGFLPDDIVIKQLRPLSKTCGFL